MFRAIKSHALTDNAIKQSKPQKSIKNNFFTYFTDFT